MIDNLSRGVRDAALDELEESTGVGVLIGDLRDPASVEDLGDHYTHIFHFAALLGVQNVLERPAEVFRDNVSMLTTVLDLAARQAQLRRFVFPSTSEVYVGTQQQFEHPHTALRDDATRRLGARRAPDELHAVQDLRGGAVPALGVAVHHRPTAQLLRAADGSCTRDPAAAPADPCCP